MFFYWSIWNTWQIRKTLTGWILIIIGKYRENHHLVQFCSVPKYSYGDHVILGESNIIESTWLQYDFLLERDKTGPVIFWRHLCRFVFKFTSGRYLVQKISSPKNGDHCRFFGWICLGTPHSYMPGIYKQLVCALLFWSNAILEGKNVPYAIF